MPTLEPSHSNSKYMSKENECLCSQKSMYKNVHSSLMNNSKISETMQMSTNRKTDKSWHIRITKYDTMIKRNTQEHN